MGCEGEKRMKSQAPGGWGVAFEMQQFSFYFISHNFISIWISKHYSF